MVGRGACGDEAGAFLCWSGCLRAMGGGFRGASGGDGRGLPGWVGTVGRGSLWLGGVPAGVGQDASGGGGGVPEVRPGAFGSGVRCRRRRVGSFRLWGGVASAAEWGAFGCGVGWLRRRSGVLPAVGWGGFSGAAGWLWRGDCGSGLSVGREAPRRSVSAARRAAPRLRTARRGAFGSEAGACLRWSEALPAMGRGAPGGESALRRAGAGLRTADCGLRTADCGTVAPAEEILARPEFGAAAEVFGVATGAEGSEALLAAPARFVPSVPACGDAG